MKQAGLDVAGEGGEMCVVERNIVGRHGVLIDEARIAMPLQHVHQRIFMDGLAEDIVTAKRQKCFVLPRSCLQSMR